MSKFDDFLQLYNNDRAELSGRLSRIETNVEGIKDFETSVTEHEVKIKALAEGVSANHKRIKGVYTRAWVFLTSLVVAMAGGIFSMFKYLSKHGGP